ncbi:UNVERIFIED_CONTAM: hypothetical protein FKN15_012823 [Acipenser sinensis]
MSRKIQAWCEKCTSCQARRAPVPRQRAPMKSVVTNEPFQKVAADILELPITNRGNRYVLVVQDYFTKYVNLFALPDQRAMTVAKCLFENYIREHGIPESLHTDQGRQFESDLVHHLCQLLGVKKTRTSPYHPQGDGMVECFNITLIDQLAKTLLEHSGEWDDYLNPVALAYNTSTHSSTGFTPFFLTHGREARLPADVMFRSEPQVAKSTPGTPSEYAALLIKKFQVAFNSAAKNNHHARLQQKRAYDQHVRHNPYQQGDLVWLHDPTMARMKLSPHWKGPYEILDCLGSTEDDPGVNYRIRYLLEPTGNSQVVHYNRLRKYTSPVPQHLRTRLAEHPSIPKETPQLTALSGALPFKCPEQLSGSSVPEQPRSQSNPSVRDPCPSVSAEQTTHSPPGTNLHRFPVTGRGPTAPTEISPSPVVHHERRQIKPPKRFQDFVMSST